jgi:hypothetical protein
MELVIVRMLQGATGAPDGVHPFRFEAGQQYQIPKRLADLFVARSICVVATVKSELVFDEPSTEPVAPAGKDLLPSATLEPRPEEPESEGKAVLVDPAAVEATAIPLVAAADVKVVLDVKPGDATASKPKKPGRKPRVFTAETEQGGTS